MCVCVYLYAFNGGLLSSHCLLSKFQTMRAWITQNHHIQIDIKARQLDKMTFKLLKNTCQCKKIKYYEYKFKLIKQVKLQ